MVQYSQDNSDTKIKRYYLEKKISTDVIVEKG